jgi:hypothetical protein
MSLDVYKLVHLVAIFFLFIAFGSYMTLKKNKIAGGVRLAAITHGIATLVILISGFGLLARLGYHSPHDFPSWVWVKFGIWAALAVALTLIKRASSLSRILWFLLPTLGALAAYMAIFKPSL